MLSIAINGDFRAYPPRLLLWHEIVNDTVNDTGGGVPVPVGYCPLCNSGVVFERRLEGRVLEFGMDNRALPRARFPYALPPGVAPLARAAPGGAGGRDLDAGSLKPREAGRARWPGADLAAGPEFDPRHPRDRRGPHLGNVVAQRRTAIGLENVAYDVSLAFAFSAFHPDGVPQRQ